MIDANKKKDFKVGDLVKLMSQYKNAGYNKGRNVGVVVGVSRVIGSDDAWSVPVYWLGAKNPEGGMYHFAVEKIEIEEKKE